MGDYVVDPYPHAKFHQDTITPFAPQIRENVGGVTRLVFLVLPTAKTPAPICTIDTSNDVISLKDVPLGGRENKILHFDPHFPQKPKILGQFSMGLRKFRDKKALTMGMLESKLPLIVVVAPLNLYSE